MRADDIVFVVQRDDMAGASFVMLDKMLRDPLHVFLSLGEADTLGKRLQRVVEEAKDGA